MRTTNYNALLRLLGLLFLMPTWLLWYGFTLRTLWAWFMVPVFGLRVLSLADAAGLWVVVHFLTRSYGAEQDTTHEQKVHALSMTFFAPAWSLAFGWAIHHWVG